MELRAGYKKTEIGVIPEDWEVKELGNILKFGSGRDYKHLKVGNIPVFGTGGLMTYVNEFLYDGESVGIGRKGTIDKPQLLNNKFWTVDTLFYTHSFNGCIPKFIYYKFCLIPWKNYNEASGVPSLNKNNLEQIQIPLPPLPEQTAIATVLSDTDNLLQALQKKIAKKQAIKKGAMQVLLSPYATTQIDNGQMTNDNYQLSTVNCQLKKGWVVKTLGEVCDVRKGQLITSETKIEGNIPVIAGGKKAAYYHNNYNRKGKTITISGSGANAGYVSFHNYPIFASDCSTISESANYSIEFILYFLQENQEIIYKMQTGGAQPHIHPKDLNPMEFPFPPKQEQAQIAQILSDMDTEIENLEKQLAKYKLVKQGLMQVLLTGKTRLISG